jgi:hypothetical protein
MAQKGKRDWLEPPEWWKKVRPLRWLLGALVLFGIVQGIRALLPKHADESPKTVAEAPPQAGPESEQLPATVPPPPPEPTPTPPPAAASSTPAPTAAATTPPPAPTPAPAPPPKPVETPKPAPPKPEPPHPEPPSPQKGKPQVASAAPASGADEIPPEIADYTRVEQDRLLMMDQFHSYENVADAQKQLNDHQINATLTSNHRKVHGDVPPYDLDSLYAAKYTHLGVEGKLTLSFFNDRLFEAEFEPADPEAYLKALRKELPYMRRGETGRSEYLEGHLRMASSLDLAISDVGRALHTRPYVLWQDRRLVRQRDAWDPQFAAHAG